MYIERGRRLTQNGSTRRIGFQNKNIHRKYSLPIRCIYILHVSHCSRSQQIQLHLKTLSQAQPQERNAGNQGTSTSGSVNDGNEDEDEDDDEDDDEEEDEEADANANTGHITAQLQNLRFGPSSPIGQASSANPYAPSMTSSGNNPFRGPLPANYSQGYSAHSRNYLPGYPGPLPHRSTTPHPGYSPYNNYPASTYAGHFGGQQGGFNPSAGSGLPSFVDHAALQQHRNGSLAFPTGYGQAQSHGGPLQDPRSIRRSATAQPGVRKSTERSWVSSAIKEQCISWVLLTRHKTIISKST